MTENTGIPEAKSTGVVNGNRSLVKTSVHAKQYKDYDSEADRYRDTIRELEDLQRQGQGHNQIDIRAGEAYP